MQPTAVPWKTTASNSRNAVKLFIGVHNEPLSVPAMCVSNPDCSSEVLQKEVAFGVLREVRSRSGSRCVLDLRHQMIAALSGFLHSHRAALPVKAHSYDSGSGGSRRGEAKWDLKS